MGSPHAAAGGSSLPLEFVRASGLAQARLQVAVLSGNRRRALEQIDRLVAIDKQLEQAARGEAIGLTGDLGRERLALASEKLMLTSEITLPRLEPAFGAGFPAAAAPDDEVEIVDDAQVRSRLWWVLALCVGFFALCAVLGAWLPLTF